MDLQDGLLHDGGSLPSRGTWVVGRWMLWFDKVAALPSVQCISLSRLRDGRGGQALKYIEPNEEEETSADKKLTRQIT